MVRGQERTAAGSKRGPATAPDGRRAGRVLPAAGRGAVTRRLREGLALLAAGRLGPAGRASAVAHLALRASTVTKLQCVLARATLELSSPVKNRAVGEYPDILVVLAVVGAPEVPGLGASFVLYSTGQNH